MIGHQSFSIKNININNLSDITIVNKSANRPYGRRFEIKYKDQSCIVVFKETIRRMKKITKFEKDINNLKKIQLVLKNLNSIEIASIAEKKNLFYVIRTWFHKIGDLFSKSHLNNIANLDKKIEKKIQKIETLENNLSSQILNFLNKGCLDQAFNVIQELSDRKRQESFILALGEKYRELGNLIKASDVVKTLPDSLEKSILLMNIILNHLSNNDSKKAFAAVEMLPIDSSTYEIIFNKPEVLQVTNPTEALLAVCSMVYMHNEDLAKALEQMNRIQSSHQHFLKFCLVEKYLSLGLNLYFDQAMEVVNSMSKSSWKDILLKQVILFAISNFDVESEENYQLIQKLLQQMNFGNEHVSLVEKFARIFLEKNDLPTATYVYITEISDSFRNDSLLKEIGEAYLAREEMAGAEHILDLVNNDMIKTALISLIETKKLNLRI